MRNYELFIRDFLEESDPETFNMLEPMTESNDKSDVYKENYYFRDHLQIPLISPVLSKQKNRDTIVNFVGKFMDDHANQLSTTGPVYIFTFGEKEIRPLYEMFNVDSEKLLLMYNEMVKEAYYGKISKVFTGWVTNSPHKILLCAILADSFQNGYDDIVECCEYMFAFTDYPIVYRDFWKIGVQEDVMKYTIEHLGGKFKIKGFDNILGLLKYDSTAAAEFYKESFMKAPDNVYMDMIRRVRNNISSKFRNIAHEYYKNIELNATQHTNVTKFDDGEIADQEGHIYNISSSIEKVNSRIVKNGINKTIARIAADGNKIDRNNLEGMISQILSTKNNRVDKFVENVITNYFTKNPSATIDSGQFLIYGFSLFRSIGTSKDPMLVEIRSILSFWMNDIINISGQYERQATRSNYSRGVYNYMIMMINYYL